MSDQEIEFYQTLYVQQGNLIPVRSCSELRDLQTVAYIGEHVKDLIDFTLNVPDNFGLLIAPVGWGKTVLLRYVWFYLVNKSANLARKVRPIYLTIDHWKADIERGGRGITRLLEELLQQRIAKLLREEGCGNVHDNEFWDFMVKFSDYFETLRQEEEDLGEIYRGSNSIDKEIARVRARARESRHYYYTALKYLRVQKGVVPIILIDNVDQLRMERDIRKILDYVILLTREYNIKILMTLRTRTYYSILQNRSILSAYPPVRIELKQPDLKNYIQKRIEYVYNKIQHDKRKVRNITIEDSKISFEDAADVYRKILAVLLNEESLKALTFIGTHFPHPDVARLRNFR